MAYAIAHADAAYPAQARDRVLLEALDLNGGEGVAGSRPAEASSSAA